MQKQFIQDLKELLVKHTGCALQGDGWPCGTCTAHLFGEVMDSEDPQYNEHNDPVDRVNEVWRAILQIREREEINTDIPL